METTPRVVGAGPVLRALCEEIGLVGAIDAVVPWDRVRCRLSPGERILALVLNLLTARQPLYRVQNSTRSPTPRCSWAPASPRRIFRMTRSGGRWTRSPRRMGLPCSARSPCGP
jgi:hypothetical protein